MTTAIAIINILIITATPVFESYAQTLYVDNVATLGIGRINSTLLFSRLKKCSILGSRAGVVFESYASIVRE